LYNAYNQIKDFYLNLENEEMEKFCSDMEEEEELMKKLFDEFNICRKNKSSFKIFIENDLSFIWDNILEKRYGKPEDKDVNGLHWTHLSYSFKNLEKSNIFLQKYHMPKNDKSSKIVIQGNFELAVSFVANELPNIYKDVFELKKISISNESNKVSDKKNAVKSCERCAFSTSSPLEYNEHMTNSHIEIVQEPPQATERQDTVLKCVKCDLEISLHLHNHEDKHIKTTHGKRTWWFF
jgi:hypothetical protein